MPNHYWLIHLDGYVSNVDPGSIEAMDFGRDFHLRILGLLDPSKIDDIHFYICIHPPAALPRLGKNVVLVILGDEYHETFDYFRDILAVLRCYGTKPHYLDGLPVRMLSALALLQFAHKSLGPLKRRALRSLYTGKFRDPLSEKTLQMPLGCFVDYEPVVRPLADREIDFAFLGSVGTSGEDYGRFSLRSFLPPPKVKARREMIDAITKMIGNSKWNGVLQKTTTFADSTSRQDAYHETMARTKISICPRGSNYETYRFYESCRAGCVVICEPLPNVWFYEGHPGIIIRDWKRLPHLLDSLLADPERLQELSAASRQFWNENLSRTVIAARIERHLTNQILRNSGDATTSATRLYSAHPPSEGMAARMANSSDGPK
jgi:hypothetical protein